MAKAKRRVNSYRERIITTYEYDGSAVRKIVELPEEQRKRRSAQYRRPEKKLSFGIGYVLFLSVICIAVLMLCVTYISRKSIITSQYETIASLESEYSELKSNNDAKYNEVLDSVSLEDIKEAAQNRLGMSYADSDDIIYYELTDGSYVIQYTDVPSD